MTISTAIGWATRSRKTPWSTRRQDERFNLGVGKTRDGKYLLMEAGSHTTNECSYLPADTPGGVFLVIAPREDEQEYYVDHRDGLFYIRTNDTGKNFRVVTVPVDGGAGRRGRNLSRKTRMFHLRILMYLTHSA